MRIIVDGDGRLAINQLCDVALKAGGIANLNSITQILASTVEEKPAPTPTPPDLKELHKLCDGADEILKNQNLNEESNNGKPS